MQTLSEALATMRAQVPSKRLVPNWSEYVAPGSRWRPGDVGDPDCPDCKGIGYMRLDVPVGHEFFGKLLICECSQDRINAARTEKLQRASALEPEDLALNWGQIMRTPAIDGAIEATRQALARGWGWVYLWGPPGPGKSLVLKCAVADMVRAGRDAVYANWSDMLQHMRAGYDAGDFDDRVEAWRSVSVLAIDEYGRAKDTDWAREIRNRVMNQRYETAVVRKSITLFASNFPPDDGEDWLTDRIRDGRFRVVEVNGPSMRPSMEAEE